MNPTHTQILENEVVSPQKSQGLKILKKIQLTLEKCCRVGTADLLYLVRV